MELRGEIGANRSIQTNDIDFQEVFRAKNVYGERIGDLGSAVFDLDEDGYPEVITGATVTNFGFYNFFYSIEYDPIKQTFKMDRISNFLPEFVSLVVNEKGDKEKIYIRDYYTGDISIYDSDLRFVDYIQVPNSKQFFTHLTLGDITNDGKLNIVFLDNLSIFIYDVSSKKLIDEVSFGNGIIGGFSFSPFSIGSISQSERNYLVTFTGKVLDYVNNAFIEVWDFKPLLKNVGDEGRYINPRSVKLVDLSGNGINELVVEHTDGISIIDTDLKEVIWTETSWGIDSFLTEDCTGDGDPDLLFSMKFVVKCLEGKSLTTAWELKSEFKIPTGLAIGDLDKDGFLEVLFNTGADDTGPDFLHIYKIKEEPELMWRNNFVDEPFLSVEIGDVNGDGNKELTYGVSNMEFSDTFFDGGRIDKNTLFIQKENNFEPFWEMGDYSFKTVVMESPFALKTYQNPAMTSPSLLIGGKDHNSSSAIAIEVDVNEQKIINSYSIPESTYQHERVTTIDVADLNADGEDEIIVGSTQGVSILDSETWNEKFTELIIGEVYALQVGNVDEEDGDEIVFFSVAPPDRFTFEDDNKIYTINGKSKNVRSSEPGSYLGLELSKPKNSGLSHIYAGTMDGELLEIDGRNFESISKTKISDYPIVGLYLFDITGDGSDEIIFSDLISVGVFDLETESILWRNFDVQGRAGLFNSVKAWHDRENKPNIAVATTHTVIVFEGVFVQTSTEEKVIENQNFQIQNYPNPFQHETIFEFTLNQSESTRLTIYNILGQKVADIVNGRQFAGPQSIRWDARGIAPGLYIYHFQVGESITTGKILRIN